jgi:hypothetical protein
VKLIALFHVVLKSEMHGVISAVSPVRFHGVALDCQARSHRFSHEEIYYLFKLSTTFIQAFLSYDMFLTKDTFTHKVKSLLRFFNNTFIFPIN